MTETPAHVVITGAAGAIGTALARAMRAAWPGVRLALVDRDEEPLRALVRELGPANGHGGATAHVADLRNLEALPALVASIERGGSDAGRTAGDRAAGDRATRDRAANDRTASNRAAGDRAASDHAASDRAVLPIDGLVNCAGVMRVQQVQTWRWDDAYSLLAINLLAPLRLQDLVVRGMVERGRGLVVNVASMAGRVPLRGCAYYGAAKAGLAMASEIARADLAGRGVRVVTVYPGPVKSALEAGARADYGGGGLFGRFAPTGDARELASRVLQAIAEDEPRVIYPRLYGLGWTAPNFSSWLTLSYGPPPVS